VDHGDDMDHIENLAPPELESQTVQGVTSRYTDYFITVASQMRFLTKFTDVLLTFRLTSSRTNIFPFLSTTPYFA
jgi:hypothetical protein